MRMVTDLENTEYQAFWSVFKRNLLKYTYKKKTVFLKKANFLIKM